MKMVKRLIAIQMAALILASAAVGVSAAYVDMLDHGLFFSPNNFSSGDAKIFDSGGTGTYNGTVHAWVPMWALDSYEPGKTYTMTFSCVVPTGVNVSFNYEYIVLQHEKVNILPLDADLPKAYHSASFDSSTGKLTFVVKFNTDVSDLGGYPVYIYLYSVVNSQIYNKMISNQWSTSVEYDPGGSNYLEFLADIRDQLHAGDDKLNNIPSNSDFSNSVSSIDSAEASLISASDPNGTALSDFSAKGKTTVTAVNTTYRQTFAFINSLVTKVMDDLDFGALVFLALTLGLIAYILGRIR